MIKHWSIRFLGSLLLVVVGISTAQADRNWTYTYHPDATGVYGLIPGQLATADGPRTDVLDITSYEYDVQGNLTKVTNALGHVNEITAHDALGRPLSLTDSNGVLTTLDYDDLGRLISRTTAGASTQYTYDAIGNVASITLANQTTLSYDYDDAARLIGIEDALGNRIDYTLDAAGNRIEEHIKDSNATLRYSRAQVYDALSRLREVVGLNGSQQFDYDLNNNPVQSIDGEAHATAHAFDALDRLTQTTDALQGQTVYVYDNQDQLTEVEDPNGNSTQYVYNAYGDLVEQTSPDTGTTIYTYDEAGNRTSQLDANGQQTDYSYDALNRLIEISDPQDTSQTITLSYDDPNAAYGIGRLTGINGPNTNISYSYTARGELANVSQLLGGICQSVQYSYDDADVLASITYPSGRVVNYTRDNAGNITAVSTTLGGVTTTLASNISYLPFGAISALTYGNGLALNQIVDSQYRLTNVEVSDGVNPPLLARQYSFNGNDDIVEVAHEGNTQWDYQYDPLRRLESADTSSMSLAWSYDANSNRLSETLNTILASYQIELSSNRLLGISGSSTQSYSYDANGNVLSKGNLNFSYDRDNRLIDVSGGASASYGYNALHQRTSKTVSGQTTYYIYDALGQLLAELDANGQTQVEYIWLENQPLAVIHANTSNADIYYIHNNHLNTPQVISDAQGDSVWQADYSPFGQASVSASSTITFNLRFPGQYFDAETGLHYNYYRIYDPATGRYIQSDPIGLEGGLNTYEYVGGNPNTRYDPDGRAWVQVGGSLIGGFVGAYNASQQCNATTKSIAIGFGIGVSVGFASTFGTGPWATAFFAGGSSAAGNAVQQAINSGGFENINRQQVVSSGITGAALGVFTGGVGNRLAPKRMTDPGISYTAGILRPGQTQRMLPRPPTYGPIPAEARAIDLGLNGIINSVYSSYLSTRSGSNQCGCQP